MTSDLKRLRFAQNSWIDVERCGGVIVGGTAPEWIYEKKTGDAAMVVWSSVAIGKPVEITIITHHEIATVLTRPLESMAVIDG